MMPGRLITIAALLASPAAFAQPDPLVDHRLCGEPVRLADGSIRRRADVLAAFRRAHPCPSTGLRTGACLGWQMDHVISLSCFGCDSVSNLQWLPIVIKSGPGQYPKDRWERHVYCRPQVLAPMPAKALPLVIDGATQ